MFHEALFKVIRMFGSRKKTAKSLRVGIKTFNNWLTRDSKISLEHALYIEVLTSEIAEKKGTAKINAEKISPHAAKQIKAFKEMIIREYLKSQREQNEPHTNHQT